MTLKQKIYNHYQQVVHDKVSMLQKVLDDLKESGANETKSTVGDKHETALAMLQIEQANKRTLLQEALSQQAALEKINPELSVQTILTGSLIKTNNGHFFMSIALGKAIMDDITVIAVSPVSPLGQKLMGLKTGESISFNGLQYVIERIE